MGPTNDAVFVTFAITDHQYSTILGGRCFISLRSIRRVGRRCDGRGRIGWRVNGLSGSRIFIHGSAFLTLFSYHTRNQLSCAELE